MYLKSMFLVFFWFFCFVLAFSHSLISSILWRHSVMICQITVSRAGINTVRFEELLQHSFKNLSQRLWSIRHWTSIWEYPRPLNQTVICDNDVSGCRFEEWMSIRDWTSIWVYHIYKHLKSLHNNIKCITKVTVVTNSYCFEITKIVFSPRDFINVKHPFITSI